MNFIVGDRIKVKKERQSYKIMACDDRFVICAKPCNLRDYKFIYFILDLKTMWKGPDNSIGNCAFNYLDKKECDEALKALNEEKFEISSRRFVKFDFNDIKIISGKKK